MRKPSARDPAHAAKAAPASRQDARHPAWWIAGQRLVSHGPGLLAVAPADELHFQPVGLDAHTAREDHPTRWPLRPVVLTAGEERGRVLGGVRLFVPRLPQRCVHERR
jgi:hypothetical protein